MNKRQDAKEELIDSIMGNVNQEDEMRKLLERLTPIQRKHLMLKSRIVLGRFLDTEMRRYRINNRK